MIPKKWLENGILAGIFLVPLVPIFISESLFFPFITGKNILFRFIVEVILALYVLLAYEYPEYRPKRSWISYAVLTFIVVMGFADLFGALPSRSFWSNFERMEGFIGLLHLSAYFLVLTNVMRRKELWDRFWHVFIGVGFFESLFSMLQVLGVFTINQGAVRVDATFGNAIYLAVFMLFMIFMTVYYFFNTKNSKEVLVSYLVGSVYLSYHLITTFIAVNSVGPKPLFSVGFTFIGLIIAGLAWWAIKNNLVEKWKYSRHALYGVLLLTELVTLYDTATRGAILGLIGGMFVVACVLAFKGEGKAKKISRITVGAILAVVLVFIALRNTDFVVKSPVLSRFRSFNEATVVSRTHIWAMGLEGWKEHPVLGWGQENFNLVFNKYYDPRLYAQEQWFDRAHNVILDWLVAGGLLGLVSYLGIFVALFWTLKKLPEDKMRFAEKTILAGLVAAYFAQNITVFDNITSYIMFFSLLAFVESKTESSAESKSEHSDHIEIVSGLVVVAFLAVFWFVVAKPTLAARTLILAISDQSQNGGVPTNIAYFKKALAYKTLGDSEAREQLVQYAANVIRVSGSPAADLAREVGTLARDEINKQIVISPTDSRNYMFAGVLAKWMRLYDESITQFENAVKYSPRKQSLMLELMLSYIAKGNYDKALALGKQAYELDKSYIDAQKMYGLAALYAHQDKLANELLAPFGDDITRMGVINDEQFLLAYAIRGEYDKVIQIWNNRIKADPMNARAHISLGAAYVGKGQIARGIAEMKKAAEMDPSLAATVNSLIAKIQSGELR